ncbi:hypothetical protein XFF6166_290019 [Xanthomonas citri pv. fuscans]|nr:hypothetical protein XFF6166_290019 [Xanthomonas citri pv. fuscans]SOO00528.1 hypothetical protein XFF6960_330018 [Xanthomonas citri pv. fuscans]SOO04120.1 hypothetical protein XFF7767_230009 [Xanthomonas citri pv. fuscans]SOO10124.1 hypothetical protein XFF6970_50005 [Xanthomonas citri pv. fuscans]SOO14837.1 hypothetical protein XFF7766_40016 [Xanthomonas citri pv. fuscans]
MCILIDRPTSQPLVESTVSRALNGKYASSPLRDADSVRSFIQLRGLRPPCPPYAATPLRSQLRPPGEGRKRPSPTGSALTADEN